MQTDQAVAWRGRNALDANGEKIGKIEEIYLDNETNEPEWLAVKTGFFGSNVTFIPVAEATESNGDVRVPYDESRVKSAPNADPDGQLSQEEEASLYRHYGLAYSERESDSGLPHGGVSGGTGQDPRDGGDTVGRDVSGPTTDDAMTRSEEEVRVGTAQRESGRARLRKYVVEDEVTETVPVKREEVRVEREPITDANLDAATDGRAISEEEHEVVLHAEEPVVEKQAVPKERIRLDKDTITDEQQVTETARKEQIEVDGDDRPRSR
jgi:uncharacterized protein (TIGR02271 family)